MENVQINVMVRNLGVGQHKIHCPSFECRDRKKKNLRTPSVKVDHDGAFIIVITVVSLVPIITKKKER